MPMLARLLDWYLTTSHPIIAGPRRFVRRHPGLRAWGRAAVLTALNPKAELARRRPPPIGPRTRVLMEARQVGGALSIADLVQVWEAGKASRRASCLGETAELAQVEIVLRAANPSIEISRPVSGSEVTDTDLIVVTSGDSFRHRQAAPAPARRLLRVGAPGAKRADHHGVTISAKPVVGQGGSLREKLARGDPLHVIILNDAGFRSGSGIAAKRQAASFLLRGWRVSLVTWSDEPATPAVTGIQDLARNFAAYCLTDSSELVRKVTALRPDLVLVGILHGSGWPLGMLADLRDGGIAVAAYMHDCYFVTGRCAYMGSCRKFLSGCDHECPTADEPPRLPRDKIAPAWRERAELFSAPAAIPLIANSRWTQEVAVQRFGSAARTDVVHLGVDHDLFAPMDKPVVRKLLDLPVEKTIVAIGAFDLTERRKGGTVAQMLCRALGGRDDVDVIVMGRSSGATSSARSLGRIDDERLIPFVLNAADIFVSTAIEEAFGQMLLEASACAVPVVAFDVGGVRDVVVHEETGILVGKLDATELLAAVERLISDPQLRERFGRSGRAKVERQFTLAIQADAWAQCLRRLF